MSKKSKGVKLSEPKMSAKDRRYWLADEAEGHFSTARRLEGEAEEVAKLGTEERKVHDNLMSLAAELRSQGHKIVAKAVATIKD